MRPESCYCDLDADGHCGRCRRAVNDTMRQITTIQVDAAQRIDRVKAGGAEQCHGCALRYLDGAAAIMVRDVLSKAPRRVAETLFNVLSQQLIGLGVTGLSQVMRAWDEVRRDNGWDLGPGVDAE